MKFTLKLQMEQNFNYESLPVRIVTDEDEQTWFAGIDICKILEYADPDAAIKKLDEDERNLTRLRDGSGQLRKTWTVNEPGLYSLILTSTKPEAKAFKRWVIHEVLPSIRKAGKYTTEQEKNHELSLRSLASEIEKLKERKDELQKSANDLKRDIELKTLEMIAFIKKDKSQIMIEFPE